MEFGEDRTGGEAAIYVFDCSIVIEGRVRYCDVPRIATFRLPPLSRRAQYTRNFCVSSEYGIPRPAPHQLFIADPALRLIVFQIDAFGLVIMSRYPNEDETDSDDDDPGPDESCSMCTNKFLLFAHAGSFLRFCNLDVPGAEIPWEQWAPHARVWLKDTASGELHQVPHGRRICTPEYREDTLGSVMIYDFARPCMLRRLAATGESAPWEYILKPSVIKRTRLSLFRGKIWSGLPFRKVDTGLADPHSFFAPEESPRHSYLLADDSVLSVLQSPEPK